MDSGNSSSMQSSSGGDEEYDSRPESIPAIANPSTQFLSASYPRASLLSPNPQSLAHLPTPFDPYLQPFPHSQAGLSLNPYLVPSRVIGNPSSSSASSSATRSQAMLVAPGSNSGPSDQTKVAGRNPRKRTRASRRAPTTVLTTDTSNFRAMVQEFTGIPEPPFSGSSYSSRRLDLFGAVRSSQLEPVGSLQPLRSLAQKVQPIPHVLSSSSSSPSSLSFMHNIAPTLNIGSAINDNYTINASLSASATTLNSPINNLNLPSSDTAPQSPILNFQSLLRHPSSLNIAGFGGNSQGSSSFSFVEDLGTSHGHVHANFSGLQDHAISEGTTRRNDTRWRDASAGFFNVNQDQLRYFNEKNLDNVTSMGEDRYS